MVIDARGRRPVAAGGKAPATLALSGWVEAAPRLPEPIGALDLLRVGDAFAAMDPLSGHGQFWAVSSAVAAAVRRTLAARPGSESLCRRFLTERALQTSLHQARIGRDFLRAEPRFRAQPFWSARLGFPDDRPAAALPESPRIARAILVEDGPVDIGSSLVENAIRSPAMTRADGTGLASPPSSALAGRMASSPMPACTISSRAWPMGTWPTPSTP